MPCVLRIFHLSLVAGFLALTAGCGEKPAPPARQPDANGPDAGNLETPEDKTAAAEDGAAKRNGLDVVTPEPEVDTPEPEVDTPGKPDDTAQRPAAPTEPLKVSPIEDPPVVGTPQEAFNFPRPPLEMPPVLLTNAEQASTRVNVGDAMPALALPDLEGKPHDLASLRGKQLTVVVFWNPADPYAVEEVGDLPAVVGERFGEYGVNLVGIATGTTAEAAAAALKQAGADFVTLVDADGAALQQVAEAGLPRTFLLDAEGNVLWFDLEYSRSTRRDLVRAIQFTLLNKT